MTNREKIIRINEIAVRCINAGPISLESGIEKIREIVNGVTLDEPREVPAEVEFDAEEITRIVDAAVDRIIKEHFPDLDKTTPIKPREKTLRELQTSVHDLACEKGWWDNYDRDYDDGRLVLSTDQVISKVALIHAELSEAVEEARKSNDHGMYLGEGGKPEGFVVELADAVIRTLDLCGALGLDLEAAIVAKHEFNKTRPRRHGGKLA